MPDELHTMTGYSKFKCKTCANQMKHVAKVLNWCPYCGSLQDAHGSEEPMLVYRARRFAELVERNDVMWLTGVHECIHLPKDRPT